ncbi:UDP-N-acetylglucosamine 1-carboxyvinyltransferase [Emcibacter sp. SYSU 3D8]|uniref:UDP-N-acetylglucosamine 1-carboxyvinyltransferase n=1 Tax=Emcibacter sp. SYSU 3D8 TaxID=3133969 RepID=UPI0031FF1D8B
MTDSIVASAIEISGGSSPPETLIVRRSRLYGTVRISGAKNSALRLLAASLLTDEPVTLTNFPTDLLDAQVHIDMLEVLGKSVRTEARDHIVIATAESGIDDLVWRGRSIRNTLLILGALTARHGHGRVPLPGGCKLGDRKYDLHVMLLEALGARVWEEGDNLVAAAENGLVGADIHLPIRSTGATENAILCGTLARGRTVIWNPHIRPEILDLIGLLRKMGADIDVYGQERIEINGQEGLTGAVHQVIPDNMEAVTWLAAAAMTGGEIEILDMPFADLEVVLAHLKAAGAQIYARGDAAVIRGSNCYPIEISTGPHPGINSDVQPILAAWGACAKGESRIVDLRFPGRYGYALEMAKMGVEYAIDGDMLRITGRGGALIGAEVRALDLRAGAALTLCGMVAEGETRILDPWQIFRGYSNFRDKLAGLGAEIESE